MAGYYIVKRYHFMIDSSGNCAPVWVKTPFWEPIRYQTWGEAADAYIKARLGNVLALGVPGYAPGDIDISFEE